jgi:flavorubredoxin
LNCLQQLKSELMALQEEEDAHWRQRAKEEWLKFGDRNSKYFHACVNQKRKAKMINQIVDEHGQVWETQEQIGEVFVNFFQHLFTAETPSNV